MHLQRLRRHHHGHLDPLRSRASDSMDRRRPSGSRHGGWAAAALASALLAVLGACDGTAGDPSATPNAGGPAPSPTTTDAGQGGPTTTPRAASATVDVMLAGYAIELSRTSATGDLVTFAITNRDGVPHDLVLVSTDLPAAALPTAGIRVDEQSPQLRVLGRSPTLPAGGTATLKASVAPGRYVLVCTVPHHYVRESMVATLTVS